MVSGLPAFFNHCGIRVTYAGRVTSTELLNVGGENHVVIRPNVALDRSSGYEWTSVGVGPADVLDALGRIAPLYDGGEYSFWPWTNSNHFVYDVITGAGGVMPRGVLNLGPGIETPGICGAFNLGCR